MLDHVAGARRAINLQRRMAADHPGDEHEIGKPGGVVAMQVRDEEAGELRR